jgi:hypothetical protein
MLKSNMTDLRSRKEKFKVEITLPSRGFVNRSAFPNGKITVYPWDSATDSWLMETMQTTPASQRETVLFKLMERLCNLNGCLLKDFVVGDVNAVLLVARSLQSENKVDYLATCPTCGTEEEDSIVIPDELQVIGAKDNAYTGTDKVTLPVCQDVVETRPLRIGDVMDILTRTPENKEIVADNLALQLLPVVSVNGTLPEKTEELLEWHNALAPKDLAQLEKAIEDSTPHFDQAIMQQCPNPACRRVFPFRMVLDADFFRTGRLGPARSQMAANL